MLSLNIKTNDMECYRKQRYVLTSFDVPVPSSVTLKEQDLSLFFMDNNIKAISYKKDTDPVGNFLLEFKGNNREISFSGVFTQDTKHTNEQQVSGTLHVTIKCIVPSEVTATDRLYRDCKQENYELAINLGRFVEAIKCETLPSGKILTVTNKGTAILRKKDIDRRSCPTIMMIVCDENDPHTKHFIVYCDKAPVALIGVQDEDGTIKTLTGEYNENDISIDLRGAPTIEKQANLALQELKKIKCSQTSEKGSGSSWYDW